jgi:iron(III) transport system ATP-binding protein
VNALEVSGLYKAFGDLQVLRGLDLAVRAGSVTAVLGPSGCGKTTLLRVIAGFDVADGGRVSLGGKLVEGPGCHLPPEARRVGYVAQEGALFPHLSVAGNVAFGLRGGDGRRKRVAEMLELVGLSGLAKRRPHQLSGGEQQRVALARALAPEPEIVLLDEPFAALDATFRATLRADVQRVLRQSGTTALLVTHDQDEALSLADIVAIMREGRIAQADSPAALYGRPSDPEVARFVGMANLLPATVRNGKATCALGVLDIAGGPPRGTSGDALVMVRPEQIVVSVAPDGQRGPTGVVQSCQYFGHSAVVQVSLEAARAGEASGGGPTGAGPAGPTGQGGQEGPDWQPEGHPGRLVEDLVVRSLGSGAPEPGTRVSLRVVGEVAAFPAPAPPTRR